MKISMSLTKKLCTLLIILTVIGTTISRADTNPTFKWYPGHYILLSMSSDREEMTARIEELADYPIVRGIQKRYFWDKLELEKDQYDFSEVIDDLNYMESVGKMLVVQIQSKSFNDNQQRVPAYLLGEAYDGGIYHMKGGGYNLKFWNDSVLARFNALLRAWGEAIDDHAALALFNTEETAPGTPSDSLLAIDWTNLRRRFMQNAASCGYTMRESFPTTPSISYFNSGDSEAQYFEEVALATGQGDGGPDIYTGAYSRNLFLRHSYNLTQRLTGKVPIGYAVQWHNYTTRGGSGAEPSGYVPVNEHFQFAKNTLRANFMFWLRREPYWTDLKVMFNNLSFIGDAAGGLVSQCPALMPEGCELPAETISPGLQELLIFDHNRTTVQGDRGFPKAEMTSKPNQLIEEMLPGVNMDWTNPLDFANGSLHMRVLIRNQVIPQNMRLQFCIWQNTPEGEPLDQETCTPMVNISGNPGETAMWTANIATMWKKNNVPLNWDRARARYGVAIKNMAGHPVSDYLGWNWNGEDPTAWYPLDMRFSVVAVAKGASFSGWETYIWEEFSPPPPSTPINGRAAHWSFDEYVEQTIPDLSGNEHHLSTIGDVELVASNFGNAMQNNPENQTYAFIEDQGLSRDFPCTAFSTSTNKSFTLAAWINLNAIEERSPIISKEYQNKRGFEFAIKNGYMAAQIYKDNNNFSRLENTGTKLEAGQWYHVAMSYEHIADRTSVIRLFLNGQEDASLSSAIGPVNSNDAPLRVGAYFWSNSFQRFFNGLIDELYVYNTSLSAQEIATLMNSYTPPVGVPQDTNPSLNLLIYPNPVGSTAHIEFFIPTREHAILRIYNLQGREIKTLINQQLEPGTHSRNFDMNDLVAGHYIARLILGSKAETRKFIIIHS